MTPGEDGARPSWMGAPGYSPAADHLRPHAPLPGAPPYPPRIEHPPRIGHPPPIGRPQVGTGPGRALVAVLAWAAVYAVLAFLVAGPPPSAAAMVPKVVALVVTVALAWLGTWLVTRARAWPFWTLVLVAAPLFWVLRALLTVPIG